MTVFISSYYFAMKNQTSEHSLVMDLVESLMDAEFTVHRSPSPTDPSWPDYYSVNLPAALNSTDIFLIIIDSVWDSSTWMAIEAEEALMRFNQNRIKHYLLWNPSGLTLKSMALGMQRYIAAAHILQGNAGAVVDQIVKL